MTDTIQKFQRKRRRGTTTAITTTTTITTTTSNNNNNNDKRYHHCSSMTLALVIVTLGSSILQINVISKSLAKFIIPFIGGIQQRRDDYNQGYPHVITMDDWQGIATKDDDNISKTGTVLGEQRGGTPSSWNGSAFSFGGGRREDDTRLIYSYKPTNASVAQRHLNVTVMMRYPRNDRLGSNLQRPLNLLAYAHCKGYNFCAASGRLGPAEIFGFPICPVDLLDKQQLPFIGSIFETPVNQSGVYSFQRNDGALLRAISENIACAYSSSFRRKWRNMIFNVQNFNDRQSVASQDLFLDDHQGNNATRNNTIQVAVHIRRGDIASRHPIYISDATFLATIQKLKQMIFKVLGKRCKVHVFSEAYGDTNWTAYGQGIVDYLHLAPRMDQKNKHAMDMELNLRDWKHFITADILIVGGTFSRIASYARDDPDLITGLPLTMTMCYDLPCHPSTQFDWSGTYVQFRKDKPSHVDFINFPHPFD